MSCQSFSPPFFSLLVPKRRLYIPRRGGDGRVGSLRFRDEEFPYTVRLFTYHHTTFHRLRCSICAVKKTLRQNGGPFITTCTNPRLRFKFIKNPFLYSEILYNTDETVRGSERRPFDTDEVSLVRLPLLSSFLSSTPIRYWNSGLLFFHRSWTILSERGTLCVGALNRLVRVEVRPRSSRRVCRREVRFGLGVAGRPSRAPLMVEGVCVGRIVGLLVVVGLTRTDNSRLGSHLTPPSFRLFWDLSSVYGMSVGSRCSMSRTWPLFWSSLHKHTRISTCISLSLLLSLFVF